MRKGVLQELLEKFEVEMPVMEEEATLTACVDAPKQFEDVAKAILNGYFLVEQGERRREVHPVCVEMYYHEEWEGGVKDPIVYHRNRKEVKEEAFRIGLLHNHVSGIDITFEKETEKGCVRASALIREFTVTEQGGGESLTRLENGKRIEKRERRSTYIYDALFGQFSIFEGGFNVSWVDGEESELGKMELIADVRKNVAKYKYDREKGDYKKDEEPAVEAEEKVYGKYVRDERRWQFRKK